MNTRRPFACAFACFAFTLLPVLAGAGTSQAAPTAAIRPTAEDTPAVAVVRRFLTARATGQYDEAYKLLLFSPQLPMSAKEFAAGIPPPADAQKTMIAPVFALTDLFADTHNTRKYTFKVVSADPADHTVVLVRATPPANAPSITLRLATDLDTARTLRVSVADSLLHTVQPLVRGAARDRLSKPPIK